MIYYTNVELTKPHMAFIGRWSPLHKGHLALIEKKRSQNPKLPILILVRETKYDDYSASLRSELIKMWMKYHKIKGTIIIVPDIEGVYWGRQVGYKTEKVDVNEKSKLISGTTIRNGIKKREKTWQKIVVNKKHSYLLTPTVAKIAEKGLVVWLTGCPNAGKTTISNNLAKKIKFSYPHLKIQILDGDVIRNSALAQGIGFSLKDRNLHIKRMGQLAKILADLGTLVICSFVSPLRKMRAEAKKTIGKNRFVEVYVKANQQTRINRDKNGLYQKAMKGEITNLTGFNAPYEKPHNPDLICDTDRETVSECVEKLFIKIFK